MEKSGSVVTDALFNVDCVLSARLARFRRTFSRPTHCATTVSETIVSRLDRLFVVSHVFEEHAKKVAELIASTPIGVPIDAQALMLRYTFDSIATIAFGASPCCRACHRVRWRVNVQVST